MVELADPPSQLRLHIISEHVDVVGCARPLDVGAIEPLFEGGAVVWTVESVQESVFALIVADCGDLPRVLRYDSLVHHSVKMDDVQPVCVSLGHLWVLACRDRAYFAFGFR